MHAYRVRDMLQGICNSGITACMVTKINDASPKCFHVANLHLYPLCISWDWCDTLIWCIGNFALGLLPILLHCNTGDTLASGQGQTAAEQLDYYKLVYSIVETSIDSADVVKGIAFWRWGAATSPTNGLAPFDNAATISTSLPCCVQFPPVNISGQFSVHAVELHLSCGTIASFCPPVSWKVSWFRFLWRSTLFCPCF